MHHPHPAAAARALAATVAAVAFPVLVRATETGGELPWNRPLDTLRENLTGPTATVLILIALTFALILWSFSDNNHGLMKAFKVLIAFPVIATAGGIFSQLGISAATL